MMELPGCFPFLAVGALTYTDKRDRLVADWSEHMGVLDADIRRI
jgi:hypothetical protein